MQKTPRFFFILLLCLSAAAAFSQNQNLTLRSKVTFPGQTLANICGYAANGREYALLGASKGMIVMDVTDPDQPQQIVQIPGPDNLWKEIKTYKNYAYVVSEGGQGVQIVNMATLPSPDLPNQFYTGDGPIDGLLNNIHALHIDTTKGFLYAYGSNLANGGALVLDLNADPYNPTYAGKFDLLGYVHDGYVDNDTLYASHIGSGFFSIVDMSDKSNPQILGSQMTPNGATHNTWLSTDRKTLLTTDETDFSFLTAYDVSDPADIRLLDKIQSNPGSGSVVHNTHILGNYAITSWYKDGITLVDITKPANLVQVGNFDTYPDAAGGGLDGCWGVYPYLPSGAIVASNITLPGVLDGELWVFSPKYIRAAYLEGLITDAATALPIVGATVEIAGGPGKQSGLNGKYATGSSIPGAVTVVVSKTGYVSASAQAVLVAGETAVLDVALTPAPVVSISGAVVRADNGAPVPNARIVANGQGGIFETETDADGLFILPAVYTGTYDVVAGAWGFGYNVLKNQNIGSDKNYTLKLDKGYRDDFYFDYGWEVDGTSFSGKWERAEPVGVSFSLPLAPEFDVPNDLGDQCYATGNGSSLADDDDVENGTMILRSPAMDLSDYNNPVISGQFWCVSFNAQLQSLDSIKFFISNGATEVLLAAYPGNAFNWQTLSKALKPLLPLSDSMRFTIVCFDNPANGDLDSYEAAFDNFQVTEGLPSGAGSPEWAGQLSAAPNPFGAQTRLEYSLPESGFTLRVTDMLGRTVFTLLLDGQSGALDLGAAFQPGLYLVYLEKEAQQSRTVRLVKVR